VDILFHFFLADLILDGQWSEKIKKIVTDSPARAAGCAVARDTPRFLVMWKNYCNLVKIKYLIVMGKGDQKSTKGKIARGSYGKSRLRKTAKPVVVEEKPVKEKAEAKPKAAKAKAEKPKETEEK
jgi:ribosomal small subunit protein bTHX